MSDQIRKNKWTTKRVAFSVAGLTIATAALFTGKMDGATWVYALAVTIAGHHVEDVVTAWRGK